jgi:hypothetical protein
MKAIIGAAQTEACADGDFTLALPAKMMWIAQEAGTVTPRIQPVRRAGEEDAIALAIHSVIRASCKS